MSSMDDSMAGRAIQGANVATNLGIMVLEIVPPGEAYSLKPQAHVQT